ncbi:MAG: hypothetical protein IH613_11560 [Desulfuromonadales bacterium]|nr:hypothetical protein [Desulfuromonadales bacterium]
MFSEAQNLLTTTAGLVMSGMKIYNKPSRRFIAKTEHNVHIQTKGGSHAPDFIGTCSGNRLGLVFCSTANGRGPEPTDNSQSL